MHRSLCPANVLCSEVTRKVVVTGLASAVSLDSSKYKEFTDVSMRSADARTYGAPEVIANKHFDCWSVGCIAIDLALVQEGALDVAGKGKLPSHGIHEEITDDALQLYYVPRNWRRVIRAARTRVASTRELLPLQASKVLVMEP